MFPNWNDPILNNLNLYQAWANSTSGGESSSSNWKEETPSSSSHYQHYSPQYSPARSSPENSSPSSVSTYEDNSTAQNRESSRKGSSSTLSRFRRLFIRINLGQKSRENEASISGHSCSAEGDQFPSSHFTAREPSSSGSTSPLHSVSSVDSLDRSPSDTWEQTEVGKIHLVLPNVIHQHGHICKPTALANLDWYYANHLQVPNIPLRKNHNGFYESQLNEYAKYKAPFMSVRQIAKSHGSVQGEVLQFDALAEIAEDMGYVTNVLTPANIEEFTRHVAGQLSKGNPPLACFAVSKGGRGDAPAGFPSLIHPENEHACLIVGIDTNKNTLDIAHQGEVYSNVPIKDFYKSMNILPRTRKPESYKETINRYLHHHYRKYELVKPKNNLAYNMRRGTRRTSYSPRGNSGFKNRLFVITPDESNARWSARYA